MILREALVQAEQRAQLPAQKCSDLEYAVAASRGWTRADLLMRLSDSAEEGLVMLANQVAGRLAHDYPVEYITKSAAFCDIVVRMEEGVLVPRPETEELVQMAVDFINTQEAHPARLLELCSGSGAVALAIAQALPAVTVVGMDIDGRSVSCSRQSTSDLGLSGRVTFVQGNALGSWLPALAELGGPIDVMVSNPPYVRGDRLPQAHASSPFEPVPALYGGASGLIFYRRIIAQAHRFLRPGGLLALEIDDGLEDAVLQLFRREHMSEGRWLADFRGLPRYAVALNT